MFVVDLGLAGRKTDVAVLPWGIMYGSKPGTLCMTPASRNQDDRRSIIFW
jgi:hypothetical protein